MKDRLHTVITAEWLEEHGACYSRVEQFRQLFGEKVLLSEQNLRKAAHDGLPLSWLIYAFADNHRIRKPLLQRYEKDLYATVDRRYLPPKDKKALTKTGWQRAQTALQVQLFRDAGYIK